MKSNYFKRIILSGVFISLFFLISCTNSSQGTEQNNDDVSSEQQEVLYNIQIARFENGEITSSKTTGIKAGEEIILTITPDEGYKLKSITVFNVQGKDYAVAAVVEGTAYKFTMPFSDITIKPAFEEKVQNQANTNEQNQQTNTEEQTQESDTNEQNQQIGSEEQTQQTDTNEQNNQTTPEDTTTQPPAPTGPVRYRVEHYQQDVDGSDTYELYAIQEKRGEAGSDTAASAKNYPGFSSLKFDQTKIAQDGSTIVRIYYNRNTITYTFNPNGGNWDGSTDVVEVSGLFGAEIVAPQNPIRAGYTFNVWDKTIPQLFGSENQTITAGWNANDDTPYTVSVYLQNVEGGDNYTFKESFNYSGVTDTFTAITPDTLVYMTDYNYLYHYENLYYGFYLKPYEQINIDGDGTSVLNLYYDRKVYNVSFELYGGSGDQNLEVLYGAKIQFINPPVKEGFVIWDWYIDNEFIHKFDINSAITESLTLYAQWGNENISYRFHDTIEILPSGINGSAGESGQYVLFGDYPQSLKEEGVDIYDNISVEMGTMTAYCGSDGNLYVHNNDQYFKLEPIKWRIIADGDYYMSIDHTQYNHSHIKGLLAESILTCFAYRDGNNYLRNNFINDAFTILARNSIQSMAFSFQNQVSYIDAISIEVNDIFYGSYIFRYKEIITDIDGYREKEEYYRYNQYDANEVFPNYESRVRNPTDYAKSIENSDTRFWWITGTISNDSNYFYCVNGAGDRTSYNKDSIFGIVPTILVKFPE